MNVRLSFHDIATRRSIEDAIERLLGLLDTLDPDPDLEPDNDAEPGTWPEAHMARALDQGTDENLEAGGEDEPWLASPESVHQIGWCRGSSADGELEITDRPHDDDEREADPTDYDGGQWSNDTDIPQEGHGWHFHDAGGMPDRNSPTATA